MTATPEQIDVLEQQLSTLHRVIRDIQNSCVELRLLGDELRPPDLPETSRSSHHSG